MSTTTITPATDDEAMRAARHSATVVCLSKLPPFHAAALKLLNISTESGSAIDDFNLVFRADPALTADLLLVANSPLFGNRAKIATIRHALMHLGLERVRALASTIALGFFVRNQPRSTFVKQIWGHSIATAVIAEALGGIFKTSDMYTAGLVHDLGRLGLLLTVGEEYEQWSTMEVSTIEEANESERNRFGMNHCEAGSLVGHKWGFPVLLRTCMIGHHSMEDAPNSDPLRLVQIACRMAHCMGYPEMQLPELPALPELPDKIRTAPELSAERILSRITNQIEVLGQ